MFKKVWLSVLSLLLLAGNAFGQATTGSISGTIVDPKEAAVVGAKIVATNLETGVQRETESNELGQFTLLRLSPGRYTVKISQAGFRQFEVRELVVAVAKDSAITAKMEIGTVSESVVVEGGAPLVETTTAQTTNTFETQKIQSLPAVTGRMDSLALLAPGVIAGFGNINSNGATFSVNGQRARSNNFTIDGQDNNDNSIGGPGLFLSNIEVVKEFSVITNNFSAEYGRNQGAMVNLVTKSGTNELHGAVTAYHQNSRFFANTFENNRDGRVKPRYNDNNDGVALGGPIKKDKLFFFGDFNSDQSKSMSVNTSGNNARVITPSGLNTLIANCGLTNTLKAYQDHGPFSMSIGNPAILAGSLGTASYAPLASGDPCGGVAFTFETARITRTTATPFRQYDIAGKVDYNLSSKNTLNIRYLFQDSKSSNAGGSSAGYEYDVPARSQNLGATFTRQISTRQLNEFRFTFGRLAVSFEGGNTSPISSILQNIARMGMPSGYLAYGLATNLPQNRKVNTYQFVDNWSFLKGRNTFKAGADMRRQLTPVAFLPTINGSFTFSSISNYIRNTPSAFNGAAGELNLNIKETDLFAYFQDDFKLRPNFTLNLGVRWEYTGQPLNIVHDITTTRESDPSTAFWDTTLPLSVRTVPELPAAKRNFAPRFGFAYQPRWGKMLFGEDKTTIRGGFSIAYDPAFFNLLLNVSSATPTVFLYTLSTGVSVPTDITGSNLATLYTPPLGTADPRLFNQTRFADNFRTPYAENWTFGIQRQIHNMALEVRYAGSRGVRLYQSYNGNPLVTGFIPNYTSFLPAGTTPAANGRVTTDYTRLRIRGNTAASTYHGLQSELRGTMWHQLHHGIAYTYSHNIDNVSEVFGFLGTGGSVAFSQNPFDLNHGERGSSNYDIRHSIAYNFDWEMPWKKSQQGVVGHVLGGWEVSGIYRWTSGRPMTPACFNCGSPVRDSTFNSAFAGLLDTVRPILSNPNAPTGSTGIYLSTATTSLVNYSNQTVSVTPDQVQWIIPNANAATILGNPFGVGRNTLRTPNYNRGDFAVYKNNKITEKLNAQFRWEVRNIFNTPFFGVPDLFVDDGIATFLNPQASAGINATTFPRQMTFGLRFVF